MKRDADGLTRKERLFLEILASAPDATIQVGTAAGASLAKRQLVMIVKYKRYGITPAGLGVLAGHGDMPRAPGHGQGRAVGKGPGNRPEPGRGTGNRPRAGKGPAPGQLTLI